MTLTVPSCPSGPAAACDAAASSSSWARAGGRGVTVGGEGPAAPGPACLRPQRRARPGWVGGALRFLGRRRSGGRSLPPPPRRLRPRPPGHSSLQVCLLARPRLPGPPRSPAGPRDSSGGPQVGGGPAPGPAPPGGGKQVSRLLPPRGRTLGSAPRQPPARGFGPAPLLKVKRAPQASPARAGAPGPAEGCCPGLLSEGPPGHLELEMTPACSPTGDFGDWPGLRLPGATVLLCALGQGTRTLDLLFNGLMGQLNCPSWRADKITLPVPVVPLRGGVPHPPEQLPDIQLLPSPSTVLSPVLKASRSSRLCESLPFLL